jgi:altronate dehydratase
MTDDNLIVGAPLVGAQNTKLDNITTSHLKTMTTTPIPLSEIAIIVNPDIDNVAVAKVMIPAGTHVTWKDQIMTVLSDIHPGHRFAIHTAQPGNWAKQYGQPFARVKMEGPGLQPGVPVNADTVDNVIPDQRDALTVARPPLPLCPTPHPTFFGFKRADGLTGIRNWVIVVPTSMCSSHEAAQIAAIAEAKGIFTRQKYPNVDGVVTLSHTGGCGCADPLPGARVPGAYEATLRILSQHIRHPNVGAAIMVELGCEKTNLSAFDDYFHTTDLSTQFGKPVQRLSIQELGGTEPTIAKGLTLLPELLAEADKIKREPCPISALAIGLECGGSDAFSGLTANPALGHASDLLVSCGGRSIISETPEFFGAEHLFAQRAVNPDIADAVYALLHHYRTWAKKLGHDLTENPSPGNKAGGLLNITIKSLGAIAKSGTAPVQDVMHYGEWIWDRTQAGVYMLNTPGYDPPSITGLVGAGCQLVCFTTGRGSVFGNVIAPVIKISSNDKLYAHMNHNIDVNAGTVISENRNLAVVSREIFEKIIAVASGEPTKSEITRHREFMLWNNEGIWF